MANVISKPVFPTYKKPPINEVVCGMRFNTPDKLTAPHIGLLWDRFRKDYPRVQHAPPLPGAQNQLQIDTFTGLPLPRMWFINRNDDQLIQFQVDQFYFNWRRRENVYPRYNKVINDFESVVTIVEGFFKDNELGHIIPLGFELSYINHIPKGEGWEAFGDLPKIFHDFLWDQISGRFLPKPTSISWGANFPLPQEKGNLTVSLKHAIRLSDKVPLLVLELKAKGEGDSISIRDIREWFDVAHEMIVLGFADLTNPEIQKSVWGREDE